MIIETRDTRHRRSQLLATVAVGALVVTVVVIGAAIHLWNATLATFSCPLVGGEPGVLDLGAWGDASFCEYPSGAMDNPTRTGLDLLQPRWSAVALLLLVVAGGAGVRWMDRRSRIDAGATRVESTGG